MGLAQDLMRGVSGRPDVVALFASVAGGMERDQAEWIAALRAAGVKAAHPDDGWVDREHNEVFFCYPQFDDGVKVGDLIALGWPQWSSKKPQHRIVRVIGRTVGRFHQRPCKSNSPPPKRMPTAATGSRSAMRNLIDWS